MNVILAKTAGFCPGVRRAVDMVAQAAEEGGSVVTYGPIIHNHHVVDAFKARGVGEIDSAEEASAGQIVVIRSHGVGRQVYEELSARGAVIRDATCPFVRRIHELAAQAEQDGRLCVIIGIRSHPEVEAIAGWCSRTEIFENDEEFRAWLTDEPGRRDIPMILVSQTTSTEKLWKKCRETAKTLCTNCEIFDTICNATENRQNEAALLARDCDAMIVIGDRSSSNTKRLAEICLESCEDTCLIDSTADLDTVRYSERTTVGITAGASTPEWIIKEVYQTMSDEVKLENEVQEETAAPEAVEAPVEETVVEETVVEEAAPAEAPAEEADEGGEETFDQLLDQYDKTLSNGDRVTGIVTAINPSEVQVDLGTKHAGYIPIDQISSDKDVKPDDIFKVGDEVEAIVMRVNDSEGTVELSKKRLDAQKNWDVIEKICEDKEVVEGWITERNKGGVVANVKGIRVFIPASMTGIPKSGDMDSLVHTNQKMRITEVNRARRRVVGSIRLVQSEARKAAAEKIWAEIEVGKKYHGVVKSMTSYGAFVDIGGVDGMVHVSELSWSRIKTPADVLSIGDEVDVYVISFDPEKRKISLGYKTEETNPWNIFVNQYHIGDVVPAKIVKLMTFGAFAEIIPGVDGLIHISQISNERIDKPEDVLAEGQEVEVKIIDIDTERKRISLSMRALLDDEDQEY